MAVWEGVPFALVGKLASRKGWGRKGETKKERDIPKIAQNGGFN